MLKLFFGPMFSGKTTMLLHNLERYKLGGKKCLVLKYCHDNRYSENEIVSHIHQKHTALSIKYLIQIIPIFYKYDVIIIDEIQFFKDAAFICKKLAKNKIVEAYGLNGDFEQKPFEQVSQLIPLCDSIIHLTAIDKINGKDAPFTIRKIDSRKKELIGSDDIYFAVSRDNINIKFT